MTNNCGDGFPSQFASIPRVAVWAVLPGALATLTSEVGTDLVGQVFGEDICGLDIMFGEKKHAHVHDRVLLSCLAGLVAPLWRGLFWRWVAAAFVLLSGVDGSRFTLWH